MKKIILVAVLFATVLTSCSSSDQENLIESYTISVKKDCDVKDSTKHFVSKEQYYEVKEEIAQNNTPCYSIGFRDLEGELITGYYSRMGISISE